MCITNKQNDLIFNKSNNMNFLFYNIEVYPKLTEELNSLPFQNTIDEINKHSNQNSTYLFFIKVDEPIYLDSSSDYHDKVSDNSHHITKAQSLALRTENLYSLRIMAKAKNSNFIDNKYYFKFSKDIDADTIEFVAYSKYNQTLPTYMSDMHVEVEGFEEFKSISEKILILNKFMKNFYKLLLTNYIEVDDFIICT